jgi:hypothetical protein
VLTGRLFNADLVEVGDGNDDEVAVFQRAFDIWVLHQAQDLGVGGELGIDFDFDIVICGDRRDGVVEDAGWLFADLLFDHLGLDYFGNGISDVVFEIEHFGGRGLYKPFILIPLHTDFPQPLIVILILLEIDISRPHIHSQIAIILRILEIDHIIMLNLTDILILHNLLAFLLLLIRLLELILTRLLRNKVQNQCRLGLIDHFVPFGHVLALVASAHLPLSPGAALASQGAAFGLDGVGGGDAGGVLDHGAHVVVHVGGVVEDVVEVGAQDELFL